MENHLRKHFVKSASFVLLNQKQNDSCFIQFTTNIEEDSKDYLQYDEILQQLLRNYFFVIWFSVLNVLHLFIIPLDFSHTFMKQIFSHRSILSNPHLLICCFVFLFTYWYHPALGVFKTKKKFQLRICWN